MKNIFLILLSMLISTSMLHAETDLNIEAPKWQGKFTGIVCNAFSKPVELPSNLKNLNVTFEKVVTDSTLDNGVITATFVENNSLCRYSAIMLADNAGAKIKLIQSKAYSLDDNSDCSIGKSVLDQLLLPNNDYLYYGHPHNMAIMVESTEAKEICGDSATHFGINFIVSGRVQ